MARTGMGATVRVFAGGAEVGRSGVELPPVGISGTLDVGGFNVGATDEASPSLGVDGLLTGGVGPRDAHGSVLDGWDADAALLCVCLEVVLWVTSAVTALEVDAVDFLPPFGGPNFT